MVAFGFRRYCRQRTSVRALRQRNLSAERDNLPVQLSCNSPPLSDMKSSTVLSVGCFVQIVHQVAEAFVHTFNQGGAYAGFYRGSPLSRYFAETLSGWIGVWMAMGHAEGRKACPLSGIVQSFLSFYGKGAGEEYIFAMIFFSVQPAASGLFPLACFRSSAACRSSEESLSHGRLYSRSEIFMDQPRASLVSGLPAMNGVVTVVPSTCTSAR